MSITVVCQCCQNIDCLCTLSLTGGRGTSKSDCSFDTQIYRRSMPNIVTQLEKAPGPCGEGGHKTEKNKNSISSVYFSILIQTQGWHFSCFNLLLRIILRGVWRACSVLHHGHQATGSSLHVSRSSSCVKLLALPRSYTSHFGSNS
jgi:hypothetical protein